MRANTRFTVAIHILTLLAREDGPAAVTSEYIAGSVNTNPVVIRRLLALLRRAGLVASQGGPGGGWRLVRPAARISLRDVYRSVETEPLFALHASAPNPKCPVGRTIQAAVSGHYDQARLAVEKELARTTIAELLQEVNVLAR
jgi:Rrf2 family protein